MWLRALRPSGLYRSAFSGWHAQPSIRRPLGNRLIQSSIGHRTDKFNVSGPRYYEPYFREGLYHLWDPEKDGQFFCRGFPREGLAHYQSGGYHPVHLGDILQDGRQKIVQKFGWGPNATVWLAEDRKLSRYVAIKIYRSDRRHDDAERRILTRLSEGSTKHAGSDGVMQLLDEFELIGPNGRHLCLVLDALGPNIDPDELSPKSAWEVAGQLVEAVAYFHDLGVAHGGMFLAHYELARTGRVTDTAFRKELREDRIFFTDTSLMHNDSNLLKPLKKPEVANVRCVDELGNIDSILGQISTARVPRYLVESIQCSSRYRFSGTTKDSRIKVIGFGGEFASGMTHDTESDLHPYLAPEILFDSQVGTSADIWSLGCLIYSLICNGSLFEPYGDEKDDMVEAWITTFGELPDEWKGHCPSEARDQYVSEPAEYNIIHHLHTELLATRPGAKWFQKPTLTL